MTKKEFQDGMNSIQVDGRIREKVWNQLWEEQLQRTDGFSRKSYFSVNQGRKKGSLLNRKMLLWKNWVPVAAALLSCVILIPGIVYADEIINYFQGHLSQNPEVASNVSQSVFRDGDEHVSMEVCELLSDGYAACMTVKYTALDKEGREWLFGETLQDASPAYRADQNLLNDVLGIVPIGEEDQKDILQDGYYGTSEIEEERTKTSRVFVLEYDSNDVSSKRCLLTYPLFSKSGEKALTMKNLLKTYTYTLEGECSSADYTPRYLRISKIKYVVYGENHGIYRRYYRNPGIVSERISNEEIHSATLYFKKHSSFTLIENDPNYGSLGEISIPDDFTCNMDLRVLHGSFYGQPAWIPFEDSENRYDRDDLEKRIDHRLAIDPEDVQKLEINGDMYTLNRVD